MAELKGFSSLVANPTRLFTQEKPTASRMSPRSLQFCTLPGCFQKEGTDSGQFPYIIMYLTQFVYIFSLFWKMLDVAKCYKMGHILAKPRVLFHIQEMYYITDEVKMLIWERRNLTAWMMTFSKAQFWIFVWAQVFYFYLINNPFAGNVNFCWACLCAI